MELPDDARELQRIADYRAAAKVLRGVSNGRIVSGLLFIGFGVTERGNVYAYALAVLGVIMIGVSIGSRLAPAASWLLIHAITGISIGVINLGIAALALVIGMRGWLPLLCGGLGVFILLASVRRLGLYSRYGDALSDPATADESRELASLVQRAVLARPNDDAVFRFRVTDFGKGREWRALLYGDSILFVALPLKTVQAADRDDTEIDVTGRRASDRSLQGSLRIREKRLSILISAEALDRFDAWKDEGAEDEVEPEEAAERPPGEPPTGIRPE